MSGVAERLNGSQSAGPLAGIRVVEFAGIGPGPHAAMMLSDLGADVIRVCRQDASPEEAGPNSQVLRGRTVVRADLKAASDRDQVMTLVGEADIIVEGFRPGVMERLGFGPDAMLELNPRLIYGRMTGWGQTGPMANRAGHDINYISLTGALNAIGPAANPVPPLNLVGDYGGGSMFLVQGLLAALFARTSTGEGQIVDAAMVDGTSVLLQQAFESKDAGSMVGRREANLVDGGAPFYRTYECSDGRFVAVGAIEPKFFEVLVSELGIDGDDLPSQHDVDSWPTLREMIANAICRRTRDDWAARFAELDACVTPVLSFDEAPHHPHIAHRGSLRISDGAVVSAAGPRLSKASAAFPSGRTAGLEVVLTEWVTREPIGS